MTTIIQNVNLAPTHTGFETCAANAGFVALYTGNYFAAYSTDAGNSFHAIGPWDMMNLARRTFCCDQRVEFIPSIDTFAWVLLSKEGPFGLALASPTDIANTNGRGWTYYDVTPNTFRLEESEQFDYPQISFGDNYLYITVNTVRRRAAIIARFPLDQIGRRGTIVGQFVKTDHWYVCPCNNTKGAGWFGTAHSDSAIRVFTWEENPTAWVFSFDVNIATVPWIDFSSFTPDQEDWLDPNSKISNNITGAARSRNLLWLAWSAGKKYGNGQASPITQPHIEYVAIDVLQKRLAANWMEQRYIWNRQFGFAWPSLAANWDEDPKIALSFCFGGGMHYPQHGVGFLGDLPLPLVSTTSGRSRGAGGHYNDIRMCFPNTSQFVAAGFVQTKDNSTPPKLVNEPHYVLFDR